MPCNSYMSSREDVADGKAPQTEQPGGEAFTGTTKFVSKYILPVIFSFIVVRCWVQVFRVRVLN